MRIQSCSCWVPDEDQAPSGLSSPCVALAELSFDQSCLRLSFVWFFWRLAFLFYDFWVSRSFQKTEWLPDEINEPYICRFCTIAPSRVARVNQVVIKRGWLCSQLHEAGRSSAGTSDGYRSKIYKPEQVHVRVGVPFQRKQQQLHQVSSIKMNLLPKEKSCVKIKHFKF